MPGFPPHMYPSTVFSLAPPSPSLHIQQQPSHWSCAAAFLNLGSASDLLRRLKKNLDVSPSVSSKLRHCQNALTLPVGRWRWGVGILSHTPGLLNGNSEGKAKKATFLTGVPNGYQRRLHSYYRLHLLCSAYPGNGGRVALGCKGRGEALWPFVCDAQRL